MFSDGGCTEGIPTEITTDPTLPSGQEVPVATPISDSYISIIWQPPIRPNGPNLRYELARTKIRQPLDCKLSVFYFLGFFSRTVSNWQCHI